MIHDLSDTTKQIVNHHHGTYRNTRISRNCHRGGKHNVHTAHTHGFGHKTKNVIRQALQIAAIVAIEHKHVLQTVCAI